jgi:hypothetical protein
MQSGTPATAFLTYEVDAARPSEISSLNNVSDLGSGWFVVQLQASL